jgi:3-hydroxy-9,10-secoandrosta-1,3,5(10)-triene-9,17-dione monooxygenase reductase component
VSKDNHGRWNGAGLDAVLPALTGPDEATLRHVLGHYPTGVAVITASTPEGPAGIAMNSFTSVSMDPPLVLFCPAMSSTTWPQLRTAGRIAINVLSAGQESVSRLFASRSDDRFAEIAWTPGANGAPLLSDALGWLECTVQAEYPAGDHTVVIAEIDRMGVHAEISEPLVFFRGSYYEGMTQAVEADEAS